MSYSKYSCVITEEKWKSCVQKYVVLIKHTNSSHLNIFLLVSIVSMMHFRCQTHRHGHTPGYKFTQMFLKFCTMVSRIFNIEVFLWLFLLYFFWNFAIATSLATTGVNGFYSSVRKSFLINCSKCAVYHNCSEKYVHLVCSCRIC